MEKAKSALAKALDAARTKLRQGEALRAKRKWEQAIDMFTAGLDVKGTHDEALTAALEKSLQAARASMSIRDEER